MRCVNQAGCENAVFEGDNGDNTGKTDRWTSLSNDSNHETTQNLKSENCYPSAPPNDDSITKNNNFDLSRQASVATRSENESTVCINTDEDKEVDGRDTWDSPTEFLMSCISMSVGLGNVWRFPGVAARNGGGAFLIPYLLVLLFIGRPLYYLEMCLGQFSRYGQIKVWNMVPLLKGVGFGSLLAGICVCSYYCALMAITVYYFFASFAKQLPWAVCHEEIYGNETCNDPQVKGQLAQLYYDKIVFPQLENIDNGLGILHWRLVLCLAFCWIIIFLTLAKGVKSSGKVAYFTAIFPYFVLFILLIRGVTLKGATAGLLYFITPQWERLLEPKVWYSAVEQCFFSLATGFGSIVMFSSYNPFNQNVYKDVMIVSIMDTFTSLLAGCTIFSVMGYLVTVSNEEYGTNLTFNDIGGGPALAFVLYPQAIATFDWVPQLFAVLFMLMLFTLAVGSATSLAGVVITIICDQFQNWKRWMVTAGVCISGCLTGLLYVTEGGILMLDLIDHYGAGINVYIMAMLECAGVAYVYGLTNFCKDVEFMLGRRVGIYWKVCWAFVIPIGLCANLVYYLVTEPEFKSNGVPYPLSATVSGWLLTAFAVFLIPACAVHSIITMKGSTLFEKFKASIRPTAQWGPQKSSQRQEWLQFKEKKGTFLPDLGMHDNPGFSYAMEKEPPAPPP